VRRWRFERVCVVTLAREDVALGRGGGENWKLGIVNSKMWNGEGGRLGRGRVRSLAVPGLLGGLASALRARGEVRL